MRRMSFLGVALSAAFFGNVVATAVAQPADRPNILFIMSYDHTAQAVGAYATLLKDLDPTPNIDSLAREGVCFDNAF